MAYYSISFSIFLITAVENGTLLVGNLPLSRVGFPQILLFIVPISWVKS